MNCGTYKGVWIPGCIGTAAALGCGKTLSQIKDECTCESGRMAKQYRKELKEYHDRMHKERGD